MRLRLLLSCLPLAACGPGSGVVGTAIGGPGGATTSAPTTASISITDDGFNPVSVTVARGGSGARVTWTWAGDSPHDVTFDEGGPNASERLTGTFERVFVEPGTFTYTCSLHGRLAKVGQIIVTR